MEEKNPAPNNENPETNNTQHNAENNGTIPEATSSGIGTFDPSNFQVKHPLQNRWTWWFDNPGRKTSQSSWGEFLKPIMSFDTVEDFWRLYNNIHPPSQLPSGSDYHLFKDHIEPKWEDPANQKGGKWVVTFPTKNRKDTMDKVYLYLILACIGEGFNEGHNDEICGCVVSVRKNQDKIALWTKNANNHDAVKGIGKHLRRILEIPDNVTLGYQAHYEAQKNNSSFNNRSQYEA